MGAAVTQGAAIAHYAYVARYRYTAEVLRNNNFFRLAPAADSYQTPVSFQLEVRPPSRVVQFTDRFGNTVHRAMVTRPHRELLIIAVGSVEMTPRTPHAADLSLRSLTPGLELDEYLSASPFVNPVLVKEAALEVAGEQQTLFGIVERVVAWVYHNIAYGRGKTDVKTPAHEVLEFKEGVCQDKTHLALGMLRALGIPCRYVSGILTASIGETHAWLEFFHPEAGWLSADPTRNELVNTGTDLLTLAVGRDYGDVPPVFGEFLSAGGGGLDRVLTWAFFGGEPETTESALARLDPSSTTEGDKTE